jgi:signal transduction histidine kinase
MLLSQLSISYKCHSSIGNSLKLKDMIDEVIKTFIIETDAIYGSFYLTEGKVEPIISHGKKLSFDINELLKQSKNDEIVVSSFAQTINVLLYKLENGLIIFLYDKEIDLGFITSIYESFRQKLNISINSCLNVQKLEDKNHELEDLTLNLKAEVKKAVELTKEKEKQFFEQLKMAQMGELIGNIAHQWRQPLSNISVSASGIQLRKQVSMLSDEDLNDSLEHIVKSAAYLSNTIDDFRSFFNMEKELKSVYIEDIIDKALFLASPKYIKDDFSIIKNIDNIEFRTSENDLIQVFLNIFTNAKDALKEKVKEGEKYIFITTYKDKNNLVIEIKDNAGGVREEIIDKIFEAYFTTKKEFHGTGIGLNMSKLLVELHLKGTIFAINNTYDYKNKTYKGAIFKLVLPICLD